MDADQIKIIAGVIVILALFVKIPKIEIRLWQYLLRGIGEAINAPIKAQIADLSKQIGAVDKLLNEHIKTQDEAEILACRRRILLFDDEVRRKEKHSEEHWGNILEDIDTYTTYCREHPTFSNSKAENAMRHLKETHSSLNPQDFL